MWSLTFGSDKETTVMQPNAVSPPPRPPAPARPPVSNDRLLTPGEVAAAFRVNPKTVTRWAQAGRISRLRTPGGHSRFRESEIRKLLCVDQQELRRS